MKLRTIISEMVKLQKERDNMPEFIKNDPEMRKMWKRARAQKAVTAIMAQSADKAANPQETPEN